MTIGPANMNNNPSGSQGMFPPPPPPSTGAQQLPPQQQTNAAGQQQPSSSSASTITSAFPNPPLEYVKLYTDDNITKGLAPESPKPITDGSYKMFGSDMFTDDAIIRPLEAQGIRRLYPREFDHKKELKKMNHSILVNFLDLLDILTKCPDTPKREEKCQDINMLFIQMHHLINELRPHQARETIRVTLHVQRRQRLTTTLRMNQQIEKVTEAISNHLQVIPDSLLEIRKTIEEDIQKLKQLCLSETTDLLGNEDDSLDDMVELDSIMCNIVNDL